MTDPAERDEYFVSRLEAFGDVVIGFSLALLAVTLAVPNHAAMLLHNLDWLVAYVWTFSIVCAMWGSHYWTFRHVFAPTPASVVLNHAKLGLIILLIYTLQVLLRAFDLGNARDIIVANQLYWGCLSAYLATTAMLLAVGLRVRHARLTPSVARNCISRIWRAGITVPLIVVGIFVTAKGPAQSMATNMALLVASGSAVGRWIGRRATRASETPHQPAR
jgi:uncharacterized membrane protein